jgi:hypothetical protein
MDLTYANKLYHALEMQTDSHGVQALKSFKLRTQAFEKFPSLLLDHAEPTVSSILIIVTSDASHKCHVSRHPSHCEYLTIGYILLNFVNYSLLIRNNIAGSLLYYHEGVRTLANTWIPFA